MSLSSIVRHPVQVHGLTRFLPRSKSPTPSSNLLLTKSCKEKTATGSSLLAVSTPLILDGLTPEPVSAGTSLSDFLFNAGQDLNTIVVDQITSKNRTLFWTSNTEPSHHSSQHLHCFRSWFNHLFIPLHSECVTLNDWLYRWLWRQGKE